jgi:hypothetical protein
MLVILRSISITLLISLVVGLIFWSTGGNFSRAFTLAIVIQFAVFWVYNTLSEKYFNLKQRQLDNERIKEFTKQGLEVECSYCKTVNLVPVRFDVDNDFSCTNCGKPNAIYIGVTVTQKTSPLNMSPLLINTLNPDEQQAIDRIKQ